MSEILLIIYGTTPQGLMMSQWPFMSENILTLEALLFFDTQVTEQVADQNTWNLWIF